MNFHPLLRILNTSPHGTVKFPSDFRFLIVTIEDKAHLLPSFMGGNEEVVLILSRVNCPILLPSGR